MFHGPLIRSPAARPRRRAAAGLAARALSRARRQDGHAGPRLQRLPGPVPGIRGWPRRQPPPPRHGVPGRPGPGWYREPPRCTRELEAGLAGFTGAATALVFSSGYLANLAAVTALTAALASGPDRLRRAQPRLADRRRPAGQAPTVRAAVTPHGDCRGERRPARQGEEAALVVSDAVFSVAATWPRSPDCTRLGRRYGALLVLDEAHFVRRARADGGAGRLARALAWREPDLVRTVTLSKSLAGQGGAVLGRARGWADPGRHRARTSSSTPAWPRPPPGRRSPRSRSAAEPDAASGAGGDQGRPGRRIAADLGLDVDWPDARVCRRWSSAIRWPRVAARRTCREHGVASAASGRRRCQPARHACG